MSQFIEIRWHARGGQGAVTGATTLAETGMREQIQARIDRDWETLLGHCGEKV